MEKRSLLLTALIISVWYACNIGIVLLNKLLLSMYDFKYPVFLTLCHMLACTLISATLAGSGMVKTEKLRSRAQLAKVATLGVVFCSGVALGNVSLKYIPISFNQAIAATTPAFTALLTLIMLQQRETPQVYLSLTPVVIGVIIASRAEPSFHLVGLLAELGATGARAFKSVLQGMLLSDASDKMSSLSLLFYMAPVATLALVPLVVVFDRSAMAATYALWQTSPGFVALLLVNSAMAYFVNLFNFLVTCFTSPLTLQVFGNAKGVLAVAISVLCFRNPVSATALAGYGIAVAGVVMYSQAKTNTLKDDLLAKMGSCGSPKQGSSPKISAVHLEATAGPLFSSSAASWRQDLQSQKGGLV